MSLYTATYGPVYPGGGGTVVNAWSGASGSATFGLEPSLTPLAVALDSATSVGGGSGEPTAGNWLLALCSWRQDAGTAGTLQYPSTVNVRDDVRNFWLPVSVTTPQTGIVRVSAWMAPAARAPEFVFVSNTAYQAAVTVLVLEVGADVPWYQISVTAQAFANQGTGVTASFTPPSGVFTAGILTWDLSTAAPTVTSSGWTAQPTVTASNGIDHTGDLKQESFTSASSGSALTLTAASGSTADYSVILVSIHGIADAIEFPYQSLLQLPNWPALVTEMACGQVLNQNWTFDLGVSPWAGHNNATLSSSDLYFFGGSGGTMVITPDGVTANPGAVSEQVTGIVPLATYAVTAQITVPGGWASGAQAGISWLTSGGSFISSSFPSAVTATGGQQQITFSAVAPATAAKAEMVVQLVGTPAATVLTYVAYAALAIPGAFGAVPEDELYWTDVSSRTITQESAKIGRAIQYEQQSLEAGTLEIPLANDDGYFTAGNVFSPYYPYAGQTDVPVRVRAVWPMSITPYAPQFSGYSDDVKVQFDEATLYGYIILTASDCWSRLTAQMLTAGQQEFLADIPPGSAGGYWPCNDLAGATAAAQLAPTSLPALGVVTSKYGIGTSQSGFGATNVVLAGDPGATGWFQDSLFPSGVAANQGASLVLFPQDPSSLPPLSGGVTVEMWTFTSPKTSSITWNGIIATMIGAKGNVWTLFLGSPGGANSGEVGFTVYDKTTGAATTAYTGAVDDAWNQTRLYSVIVTQTTWNVCINGVSQINGACNFANVWSGLSFNGQNVVYQGLAGSGFNGVIQDIALYPLALPVNRMLSQYNIPLSAGPSPAGETDYQRIPRVVGYGGFVPPMAMRCLDLPALPASGTSVPDTDPVTTITDTVGQVVSAYITNIASSTLAVMFIDGTGALCYRRRLEWYDRPSPQWVLGEQAPLALNVNPYFAAGVAAWNATNAALAWAPGQGQFTTSSGAAKLTANGAGAVTLSPENEAATPGDEYSVVISVMAPAGYSTGAFAQLVWLTSGNTVISRTSGTTVPLVAGGWTQLFVTGQAPATTAFVRGNFDTTGTPSNGTVFLVSSVVTALYPGEAPYLRDIRLSDDRAQMFNVAILNQSGTGTRTTFSGTDLNFAPTSGVQVTITNEASASTRGPVPYTATVYLQNTEQSGSFVSSDGCIEDLGNWIVNTLGTPLLRGEQVTLTPGATWQDMITALLAEIGDTVVLNRRPLGAPPVSEVLYLSSISHEINIADEEQPWVTTYQLSPAPSASVLQCDSAVNGVLDGTSLLGWLCTIAGAVRLDLPQPPGPAHLV